VDNGCILRIAEENEVASLKAKNQTWMLIQEFISCEKEINFQIFSLMYFCRCSPIYSLEKGNKSHQVLVVHACNTNYSGARHQTGLQFEASAGK
jgi:hypothetical protein